MVLTAIRHTYELALCEEKLHHHILTLFLVRGLIPLISRPSLPPETRPPHIRATCKPASLWFHSLQNPGNRRVIKERLWSMFKASYRDNVFVGVYEGGLADFGRDRFSGLIVSHAQKGCRAGLPPFSQLSPCFKVKHL